MHTFVAAVGVAALIIGSLFLTSADAARRVAPAYEQPRAQRNSGGSWRCYPYCDGGTYEGRPVREWLKPDRWRTLAASRRKRRKISWVSPGRMQHVFAVGCAVQVGCRQPTCTG